MAERIVGLVLRGKSGQEVRSGARHITADWKGRQVLDVERWFGEREGEREEWDGASE